MKLKYYLKGFGIGILFATIIIGISFYISGRGKELSDEDIISKAEVLGMVMREETTVEEITTVEETTIIEEATTAEETTTVEETETQEEISTSAIKITIEKGYSSDKIAGILEEHGIITDAKEFNRYLIQKGVSRKIQSGTYEMYPGMSYEELMNMLK